MPRKKKTPQRLRPPCPDPELYQWVETKEGGHWRRRRGGVKNVTLNRSFSTNTSATSIVSPIASQIRKKLEELYPCTCYGEVTCQAIGFIKQGLQRKRGS